MKLWIARDEGDRYCKLFKDEPYKVYDRFIRKYSWVTEDMLGTYMCIEDDSINSITFENSPQEVELKLVGNGISN